MGASPQVSATVSRRYASALLDLASEKKALDQVEKDLKGLESVISESEDFRAFIRSPLLKQDQQQAAVQDIAKKAGCHVLTINFLGVLAQNRRLYALESILKAARQELSKRRGEVSAVVQTASALTDAQTKALQDAISGAVGSDVALEFQTDPDILGGMIVTVGSHMIDDSVRRKLQRLQTAMGGSANQNTSQTLKEVG